METRIQILLVVFTVVLFLLVLELVRRRKLLERYALLWLLCAGVLVALAVWRGLLESLANVVGIYYAPSALFVIAFGFVLVLLLNFSLVVSRLTDQNKLLAQHTGLLREEIELLRRDLTVDRTHPAQHVSDPYGAEDHERA
jgi:hypothetical protein